MLCVEFLLLADGRLLVTKWRRARTTVVATLDACDVSQFELQVRTLCGLPLTAPRQHSAAVMLNLLGDLWTHAAPDWARVLTAGRAFASVRQAASAAWTQDGAT